MGLLVNKVTYKLNGKTPFGGQTTARCDGPEAINVAHARVTFGNPMEDTNYRAFAILVSDGLTSFDKNYDVNVSISGKTTAGFTIDVHRGTEGYLDADGAWILDYIVLP